MPKQRYKVTLAYRGTNYHGWQTQAANEFWKGPKPRPGHGIPTVQETTERAIGSIVGHPVVLIGSSRTDTGVHAKGQLAHFDTTQVHIPPERLRAAVNYRLPPDILITRIDPVPETFDAIASTISKRYQYFIWNVHPRPIFFWDLAWHRWAKLDSARMQEAANVLAGEHDFASFTRPEHGREHAIRTIFEFQVRERGPRIIIGIEGSGFLWNMVRILVGTLVEVGMGRRGPEEMHQILDVRDRRAAGPTAPPQGLYLQWVKTRDADKNEG